MRGCGGRDFRQGKCGTGSVGPGTMLWIESVGNITEPKFNVQCWETEAEDTLVAPICVKNRL